MVYGMRHISMALPSRERLERIDSRSFAEYFRWRNDEEVIKAVCLNPFEKMLKARYDEEEKWGLDAGNGMKLVVVAKRKGTGLITKRCFRT